MSAIAPPPVGAEIAGVSTLRNETLRALAALEARHARPPVRSATRPSRTAWLGSLVGLAVNLLADLTYTWVDPRIDFETREV